MTKKFNSKLTFEVAGPSPLSGVRAAIIGAGFIGEVHARAIRSLGATLVAVTDGDALRSEAAAKRLGALTAPADAAAIFDDPTIDVVHICTPNHLHAPLAEAAIAAGKHVVCEKPLATSHQAAAELARQAEEAAVVAAVPFVYRYYPTVQEAKSQVSAGEIGDLRLIHGSYLQDWLSRQDDTNWRVDSVLGGPSRAFADIGVHWCDLIEHITGRRIVALASRLSTAIGKRGAADSVAQGVKTEDAAALIFTTDDGVTGSLVISQVTPGRKNRLWFSIDGAERSLVFDQEQPETLWLGTREMINILTRGNESMSEAASALTVLPSGHPQGYQDCFNRFIEDVYASIEGHHRPNLPTFRDGLRAAALTEAVIDSHNTHGWVEVSSALTATPNHRRLIP